MGSCLRLLASVAGIQAACEPDVVSLANAGYTHPNRHLGWDLSEASAGDGHGLKKELRLRDLVPMQILLVVGVTWCGIAAQQGGTQVWFWVLGIIFFFLPLALIVTYCVQIWPQEGGVYQWTKHAIGPWAGFLSAW